MATKSDPEKVKQVLTEHIPSPQIEHAINESVRTNFKNYLDEIEPTLSDQQKAKLNTVLESASTT